MNTIKKAFHVVVPLVTVLALSAPAHGYFSQGRQSYRPSYSQYQYTAPYRSYQQPYQLYSNQDEVGQLTRSNLNFVSNFTYIPAPVHQYFFQYYSPYYY